jgi:hypothetical protein
MRSICLVPDRILGKDSITRLHHRHLIPWRRVFFVEYQLSLGKLIKCIRQKKSLLIYRTFFAECFLNTRQELSESAVPTTTSCGRHGVPWSNLSLLRAIGIEKKISRFGPGHRVHALLCVSVGSVLPSPFYHVFRVDSLSTLCVPLFWQDDRSIWPLMGSLTAKVLAASSFLPSLGGGGVSRLALVFSPWTAKTLRTIDTSLRASLRD